MSASANSMTSDLYTLMLPHDGGVECSAVVVAHGQSPSDRRATMVLRGVPRSIAEQCARSYIALMREAANAPVEPIRPTQAAHLLRLVAYGSRRDARAYARSIGCGGGSRDLDVAIGRALIADPESLEMALAQTCDR